MILGKFGPILCFFSLLVFWFSFSNAETQLATRGGDAQSHAVVDSSPVPLI